MDKNDDFLTYLYQQTGNIQRVCIVHLQNDNSRGVTPFTFLTITPFIVKRMADMTAYPKPAIRVIQSGVAIRRIQF